MRHEGKSEGEERRGEEKEERRGRNHGENLDCGKPSTFFFFFHFIYIISSLPPSLPSDQLSQHAGQEKQSAVHSFCAADKFIY